MLSIFLKENLPFELELLPRNACLVGGSVRDALLNRPREYLDLDFVIAEDAIKLAKKIAHQYQAGFVVLDQLRNIARVVFPNATIDFAQQEGDTLIKDLQRRDYTINAIAYNPHTDNLIDPFDGRKDLENKTIRMISENNLKDDPLRLMRGYRQACQLNFIIEDRTRSTIKKLAPLLKNIAAERINTELNYLLKGVEGSKWLKEAFEDGLLSICLENATVEKVKQLDKIDDAIDLIAKNWAKLAQMSSSEYYLVKLACLLSENVDIAEQELVRLKYSRHEIRKVIAIIKYSPQLLSRNTLMSLKEQYFFFLEVKDVFPLIAISAISWNINIDIISPLIERYLNENDSVAHPQPLLSGNDLIRNLHLSPSPQIGTLLTKIQVAYIEGKIKNSNDAIIFAKSLL